MPSWWPSEGPCGLGGSCQHPGVWTHRHPLAPLLQPAAPLALAAGAVDTLTDEIVASPKLPALATHFQSGRVAFRGGSAGSARGFQPGGQEQGWGSCGGYFGCAHSLLHVALSPPIKGCLRQQEVPALPGFAAVPTQGGRCFSSRCTAPICPPECPVALRLWGCGSQLCTRTFPCLALPAALWSQEWLNVPKMGSPAFVTWPALALPALCKARRLRWPRALPNSSFLRLRLSRSVSTLAGPVPGFSLLPPSSRHCLLPVKPRLSRTAPQQLSHPQTWTKLHPQFGHLPLSPRQTPMNVTRLHLGSR